MSEVSTSWVGGSPFQAALEAAAKSEQKRPAHPGGRPALRRCDSCQYADFQRTPRGRIVSGSIGRCTYDIKMPPLPACVEMSIALMEPNRCKGRIFPGNGATCPVWAKRPS